MNTPQEFWANVDQSSGPDACWPWTGVRYQVTGYGRVSWNGKSITTQRVAFLLTRGHFPQGDGCHSCDNPPCCNPAHVFDGTRRENMQDARTKGRILHGEQHPSARESDAVIAEVRRAYEAGEATQAQLARQYHISTGRLSRIVRYLERVDPTAPTPPVPTGALNGRHIKATHCKRGHELTPENRKPNGHRNGIAHSMCRLCSNLRRRAVATPENDRAPLPWTEAAP